MFKNKIKKLGFLTLIFTSTLLSAETRKDLTWDDCLSRLWQNNPDLKAAKHEIDAAGYSIDKARASYYPDLSVSSQFNKAKDFAAKNSPLETTENFSSKASLEVFSGFKTPAMVKGAKASQVKSMESLRSLRVRILYDLRSAFIGALFADQNVELSQKIAERLKSNMEFMEMRYRGGEEAKWSYLTAKTDYEEAVWEIEKAKRERYIAYATLFGIIGERDPSETKVQGSIERYLPKKIEKSNFDVSTHPDILDKKADLEISKADIERASADHWPTVSTFVKYDKAYREEDNIKDGWSIGVDVTLPLFSGFGVSSAVNEAREKSSQKVFALESTQNKLKTDLLDSLENYNIARSQIEVLKSNLSTVQERVDIVQQEYAAGTRTYLEWEDSQSKLVEAERKLLDAKHNAAVAFCLLEKNQGKEIDKK